MDEKSMIDDLVAQLDAGFSGEKAVGHFNVDVDEENDSTKEVQTLGCTDCSRTPLACSVPTLHQGLDDYS
ncbi:MAG: hypothetical protein HFJ08_10730 [Lachnospiraceae bacterium]|jgi:hypothetical protein|nr:hypothetical protein [Lachnospiraceae bacterium]MCI9400462.1 hypothetical protein [Lachnospiraceae bacterium]MCX4376804.1 hypothetical protein [Lachnospiraceae bacterium]